jgi:DNA-binding transcriptional regulator YhcF (GntR family)
MSKLNIAKEHLSRAFADLEGAILDKIKQAKTVVVTNSGADKNNQETINNFHNEINSLQKELAELGMENENLRSFKSQAGEVVNQVKIDLTQIKKIINKN